MSESETAIRFLGDVERLILKPGDVLLVKFPSDVTQVAADHVLSELRPIFSGHRCVGVCEGVEFGVVSSEGIAKP